jgi:tRNA (guanosine-2'-O-)-methyltransferase
VHSPRRLSRINSVIASRQQGALVLENIHDMHNATAVLRNCDAFGIQRVCLVFSREQRFDPRIFGRRSSSSAHKWLHYSFHDSIEECYSGLHKEGYRILAADFGEDCTSLTETDFLQPLTALVFGNEHRGLTSSARSLADGLFTIPMHGMVQSLNLSVSAALSLYELTRQRRQAGMEHYGLSEVQQAALRAEFQLW